MLDVVIHGGSIVDGTGKPRFRGDVGIRNGKITAVGNLGSVDASVTIDAVGKLVSPGFIDMHGHSEVGMVCNPPCESQVLQGITTEVAGHCGYSPFPISPDNKHMLIDPPGVKVDWEDIDGYFKRLAGGGMGINLLPLVGHLKVRAAALKREDRPARPEEIKKMQDMVREAMEYGVAGLSVGLDYVPGQSSDLEELVDLCSVVAKYDGVFCAHVRGYSRNVLNAVCEALEVGRRTGVRVNVAHLGVEGRAQWGWMERVIQLMDKAREDGVEVVCDLIPYGTSGVWWAPRAILPGRVYNFKTPWPEAVKHIKDIISDKDERERLKAEIEQRRVMPKHGFDEELSWLSDWRDVTIMEVAPDSANSALVGSTLAEAAEGMGLEPAECFFRLIEIEGEYLSLLHRFQCDEDFERLVKYPYCGFCTDTIAISVDKVNEPFNVLQTHPRRFGTMPRIFERYVRNQSLLTLEEAVRKMCSLPAEFYRLKRRGVLATGNWADLVVFDPEIIGERGTYRLPAAYPSGIDAILINGQIEGLKGSHTGNLAGHPLLRGRD